MSTTVKEWEADFETLPVQQRQKIVAGLTALAEWPLFKECYKGIGTFQLAAGLWSLAYGEPIPQHFIDLFLTDPLTEQELIDEEVRVIQLEGRVIQTDTGPQVI